MKKTFKGFTLVECIVSLAILAIACMTLGGIEAAVAQKNNYNHFVNSSLSNQMAYIEKYENADTVKIANTYTGSKPPNDSSNTDVKAYVKVTKLTDENGTAIKNNTYSFPVDIYVMYSRDTHNIGSNNKDADGKTVSYGNVASGFSKDGTSEKEGNLRYKYILGAK